MSINISTSSAFFRWKPACWLRVTGDDAATFLQGQFTNDLRILERVPSVYGLWLTVKGKVLADSFVLRGSASNEFWIGSYFSEAATIRERLESYVIADDVALEDQTAAFTAMTVFENGVEDPPEVQPAANVFRFPGRRERMPNTEYIYPAGTASPNVVITPGAVELTVEEMARRRIAAGIPAVPVDLGPTDLPNEAGLETEAISFTKGCYLGQEVMARLKSLGQVRRRLWRVRGNSAPWPVLPAPVFRNGRQVGELRSAVRVDSGEWLGLAMLSSMHIEPGAGWSFTAQDAPTLVLGPTP
jgi:folate-binding protein YgfZ